MPRHPKPTALKVLQGNPGHRSLNRREPSPEVSFAPPPKYLDARGRQEWTTIGAELLKCRMVTALDLANLATYCAAVSRLEKSEVSLRRWERVVEDPKTSDKKLGRATYLLNLVTGKRRQAADEVRRIGVEFGLTPSSRSRIRIDENQFSFPFGDNSKSEGESPMERCERLAGA